MKPITPKVGVGLLIIGIGLGRLSAAYELDIRLVRVAEAKVQNPQVLSRVKVPTDKPVRLQRSQLWDPDTRTPVNIEESPPDTGTFIPKPS